MADPIFKKLAFATLAQTARNPTQDFLRATPRNPVLGYLADLTASTYAPQRTQQMQGVAQFFGVPAVSQTLDRLSYGEPLTTGAGGLGGTTRMRPETAEALLNVAPFAPGVGRVANQAAMTAGRAGARYAERVVPQVMAQGGFGADILEGMTKNTASNMTQFKGFKNTTAFGKAKEVAKYLDSLGIPYTLNKSKTTNSAYLEVQTGKGDFDYPMQFRFSDHSTDLPHQNRQIFKNPKPDPNFDLDVFNGGGHDAEFAVNKINELVTKATKGLPVGMSIKDVGAPQAEALRLAQQRAALPVKKGGLGLAADNTASQRAAAMGFDTSKPVFHGSAQPLDRFDNAMLGSNTGADDALIGHHFAGDRSDADLYATMAAEKLQKAQTGDGYGATGNIGEYLIRSKNPLVVDDFDSPLLDKIEAFNYAKQNKNDSIIFPYGTSVDSAYTQVVFDPENIRLKNAAFDPFRKTAATAAALGAVAPDLMAQQQPDASEAQQLAMIMQDIGTDLYTIYQQTGVWLGGN
jgi:hypothetical protein